MSVRALSRSYWLALTIAAALTALAVTEKAGAQATDQPLLMLDTGGHKGLIRAVLFTPDGRQLVSAGDDKLIRVWDWQEGKTVRTIRGNVGPVHEGKIFAMALSPDGALLAVGGYFHRECRGRCGDIRIYKLATGEMHTLLQGYPGVVYSLAFSPDGQKLIAGGSDNAAVIWDLPASKMVARLVGHSGLIWGAAFLPDGERVVTGSSDGQLRLWRVADGQTIATLVGHKDKVRSVAVSSKGTIASGDTGGEIRLWDGATGRFLRAFRGQKAQIPSLAFTPDGKRLVAGIAKLANSVPPFEVAVWNVATGARERVFTAHDGGVWAVAVSPDGRVAASAGGKSMPIYLWDPATGQRVRGAGNAPLSLQGTGSSVFAVAFSADSKRIAWGFTNKADKPNARGPLEFTLQLPTATQGLDKVRPLSNRTGAGFVGAVVVKRNVSLVHRLGGEPPRPEGILDIREGARTVGSIVRGSATGHRHLSYTFSPDGNTIISGGANGILVAYDAKGQEIGPFVGHEGDVWAVATSPDGQMLLSGGEDQIVRLWNLQKRELIVSLFQGGNEWIMWTPQGYYASSPDGDRLVGWQINKGLDKAAEYYTARQLKGQFYRPDIVERALVMASADRAYEEAQKADPARLRFDLNALLDRKPPKFSIAQPADGARVSASSAEILIAFEEASDPITRVEVFVGGTQVTPADLRGFTPVVSESRSRNIRVPLAKGENRIVVRVSNAVGTTDGKLTLFGAGPGALDRRGTLFIVAIGVNKYPQLPAMCRGPEGSCELNHAGADARAFIQEMARKAGMLHQRVETRLLVNGAGGEYEPTSANIINALSVLKQSTENDSVIVFLSGHGANEEIKGRKNYLFLPTDARRNQGGWVDSTVFDWALLERSLSNASGRRVLFVDTCHAANSYSAQILKNAADDNVVVFTAADREAEAQEQGALGHGVFTYAILRGLEGEAARDKDVWVLDLATFVDREVRRLTNGGQVPEFRQGGKNYVIARTP